MRLWSLAKRGSQSATPHAPGSEARRRRTPPERPGPRQENTPRREERATSAQAPAGAGRTGSRPTPARRAQAASQLDGLWKLVYASNSGVLGLLGLARLPGVTVGDITQSIESSSMSVQNKARRAACLPAGRCGAAGSRTLTQALAVPASSL